MNEYPLVAWRFAPHNQRIEQMRFGHSSSAALGGFLDYMT